MKMNKKGVALIFAFIVIVVLTVLGSAIISRSISEVRFAQRYAEYTQSFWLAEAGINRAWNELRANYDLTVIDNTSLGPGGYNATIATNADGSRTVTAHGFIPNVSPFRVERTIEVKMNQYQIIPTGFYDNAIYSAGNVTIGSNCPVNGNVFSGGTVTGSVVSPSTVIQNVATLHDNGLPALSYEDLKQKSIDQGWYDPDTNTTTFPTTSFYNIEPSTDYPEGIPNVVFVNGDFTLVGGHQLVKGFIVVGGNMIYNAEIGGNATVDGCIYTRGNIWLHGGGGNILNVNGGVWAGGTATLDGNEQIDYNPDYMDAIREGLHPNTDVRILSWRDTQNPYQ